MTTRDRTHEGTTTTAAAHVGLNIPAEPNAEARAAAPRAESLDLPRVGLGTFRLKGDKCAQAVATALACGVRLIDTAESYNNAEDIVRGVVAFRRNSKLVAEHGVVVPRVITKISKESLSHKNGPAYGVRAAVANQRRLLRGALLPGEVASKTTTTMDGDDEATGAAIAPSPSSPLPPDPPLDIVLLHWPGTCTPNPKSALHRKARTAAWVALLDEQRLGHVRHVGVSNFTVSHLRQLVDGDQLPPPALNQVECHPYNAQRELCEFCAARGIAVQPYTSLGRSAEPPRCLYGHFEPDHPKLVRDPAVVRLAAELGVSCQVLLLRWALAHGLRGVIPKATSPEHIRDNLQCVDEALWREIGERRNAAWLHELDGLNSTDGGGVATISYAYAPSKVPE